MISPEAVSISILFLPEPQIYLLPSCLNASVESMSPVAVSIFAVKSDFSGSVMLTSPEEVSIFMLEGTAPHAVVTVPLEVEALKLFASEAVMLILPEEESQSIVPTLSAVMDTVPEELSVLMLSQLPLSVASRSPEEASNSKVLAVQSLICPLPEDTSMSMLSAAMESNVYSQEEASRPSTLS